MPTGDEIDWGERLYSNPNEGVRDLIRHIEQRTDARIRQGHQEASGQRQFWEDFYAGNGDLDPRQDHDIVQTVLHANIAELADLPVADARAKLGEMVQERIQRYRGHVPGETAQDRYRREREAEEEAVFQGGPHHQTYQEAPRGNGSLGDAIRARRAARRAGGRPVAE